MSKAYILFTEEDLDNLRDGIEIKCTNARGDTLYCMLEKHFDSMVAASKEDWNNNVQVKGEKNGYC